MPARLDAHLDEFHRDQQWHKPVRVATTANVTISTALNAGDTIDGVTLAAGDRVLVKSQSTGSQNGIYIAGATPARAYDMLYGIQAMGAFVYVIAGTANGAKVFYNTNTTLPTIDTTALTFAEFAPAGAGGGISTVQENGSNVVTSADLLNFTTGLDVTNAGSGDATVAVDPSEIAIDTLGAPSDITTLNASTSAHGLLKKLDNSASHFMDGQGNWSVPSGTGSSVLMEPFYGDGRDGNVTISVDTTITRDMYYNDLTVNSGINLDTALLRVFVKGTLTLTGTIRCNGNNGGNGGNGTGAAGGAAGTKGAQQTGGSNQTLPNGSDGIAGTVGGINANGTGTTAASQTTHFGINVPAGAAGGVSGSGRSGGAGGGATTGNETIPEKPLIWPGIITWGTKLFGSTTLLNFDVVVGRAAQAGSGGGAAGAGGGGSGGGGSSGGIVVVCAKTITGAGTIQAKGGNGGNGGNGFTGGQAGGGAGGNGGQGGIVVLISKDATGFSGTLDVAGGTKGTKGLAGGGAGSTDGSDGNNGNAGRSFQMQLG